MGIQTAIAWATSTYNPWWGCMKISEACRDCYAEAWAKRTGHKVWGPTARRRFFGDEHWNEPRRWNRAAAAAGKPWRVFCSSMADVFEELPEGHADADAMAAARTRLWQLIAETPYLTWMLLTKRPENIERCFPWAKTRAGRLLMPPPPNVWLGTTVENQPTADVRLERLLSVPAIVHFVSAEPLLERVNLLGGLGMVPSDSGLWGRVDWVICGGESGGSARPFDLTWARDLRDQCRATGTAFFMKQLGAKPHGVHDDGETFSPHKAPNADPAFWPVDLTMQEFPIARAA